MSFTLPNPAPKLNDETELRRIATGVRELAKGNITFQGEIKMIPLTITNADSPYTLTAIPVLMANAGSGAITVNLPPVSSAIGRLYLIKKADATVNALTLVADGAELIDGAATKVLNTAWASAILYSDGTQWVTF